MEIKLATLIRNNEDKTDIFLSATKQIKLAFFIFNNEKLATLIHNNEEKTGIFICNKTDKTGIFYLQQWKAGISTPLVSNGWFILV